MASVQNAKGMESVNIAMETAWMLQKVRNERVIGKKEIRKEQVKERWKMAMKKMIEEETGRIHQKELEKQKERDCLKVWGTTDLVIQRRNKRIKVKEQGKDW